MKSYSPFAAADLPVMVVMVLPKCSGASPTIGVARHLSTLEKSFVRLPDSLVEGEKVVFSFSTNFAAIAKDSAWNSGATLSASNRYKELRTKYHLWTNELGTRRLAVNRAKEDLQKLSASPVKGLEQILKTRIDLTNITQRLGKDSELLSRDQQTALLKLSEAERAFANLGARQKDVKVRGEELIQNAKNTLSLGVQADTNQMVSLAAGLFRLNQEAMTNGLSQLASELASSAVSLSNAIPLVVAQQGQGHVRDEIGLRLKTLRERFSVLSEYSLGKDWENLLEDSGRLVADSRSANLRDLTEEADQFRAAVQSGRQGAQRLDLLVREVRARLGELEKLLGKDPATTSPDEIAVGRQTLEKLKAEVPRLKSAELQKQLTRVAAEMVRIEKRENLRRLERTFEHVKSQIELARTNAASRATLLSQLDALEEELEPLSDPDFVARIKSARANVASLQDVVPNQGGTGVEPIKQGSDPNSKPGLKGVTMGSFQLPLVEMTLLGKRMWVGASEVTRGEFLGVMGHLPKGWKDSADVALTGPVSGAGDRYPATFVSPMEAEEFCRRLGEAAGGSTPPKRLRYRLPTWQEHQELRGALESEPAFNLRGRGLRERPVEVRRLVDAWGNAAELASKDGGWVLVGASYSDRDTAINSMTSNPAPAKDPPVVTQGFRVVAETLP